MICGVGNVGQESHTEPNIRHHLVTMLGPSSYSRPAGYDDFNDTHQRHSTMTPIAISKTHSFK